MQEKIVNNLREWLGTYLFNKVWNEPYREYRRNIIPLCLSERSVTGRWVYKHESTLLPTGSHYIYAVPRGAFGNIKMRTTTTQVCPPVGHGWIQLNEFLNKSRLTLRVHGSHGEMLHRGSIYVKDAKDDQLLLMAVNRNMLVKILGAALPKDIYVAVYFDSDIEDDIVINSWVPSNTTELNTAVNACLNAFKPQAKIYRNGRYCEVTHASDIKLGDYVEIETDDNIKHYFDLDLANNDHNRQYVSLVTDNYNLIVHIPKAFNSHNELITHNTCDVFVRARNATNATKNWLFVHRANPAAAFVQLTHNDFAIPVPVLDSYASKLGTDEIVIRVILRTHNKNNRLIRDANYIDHLYLHNDTQIHAFLAKEGPVPFTFWSAEELEVAGYTQAMFRPIGDRINPDTMSKYIDALGHLHTLALICDRVRYYKISPQQSHRMVINYPLITIGTPVRLVIYHNGLKINNTLYTVTHKTKCCNVLLDDSVVLTAGDDLIVEFFDDSPNPVYQHLPTVDNQIITVTTSDYNIYHKVELLSPIQGVERVYTHQYLPIASTGYTVVNNGNGTSTYMFTPETYGKECYLQSTKGSYYFSRNIDTDIINQLIPRVDLDVDVDNVEGGKLPIIGHQRIIVFLNGKHLIDGLDYQTAIVKNNDIVVASQIILQNMSYLQPNNNVLEVLVTRGEMTDTQHGYMVNEYAAMGGSIPLWVDGLSMIYIDGHVVASPDFTNGRLTVGDHDHRNGAPFGIRTLIPQVAIEFLNDYPLDDDITRYLQILEYLHGLYPDPEGMVIIENSHWIYSIFIHTVIREVLAGRLLLTYEPDDQQVLNQAQQYFYLKYHDLVYKALPDLKYVDLYPTYRPLVVNDPAIYKNIARFVAIAMPKDTIQDGSAVDGNISFGG